MAVLFIEVGQEVHITGGNLTDAVNEGVRQGYVSGDQENPLSVTRLNV